MKKSSETRGRGDLEILVSGLSSGMELQIDLNQLQEALQRHHQAFQNALHSRPDRLQQAIYAPENYPSPGIGFSPEIEFQERRTKWLLNDTFPNSFISATRDLYLSLLNKPFTFPPQF